MVLSSLETQRECRLSSVAENEQRRSQIERYITDTLRGINNLLSDDITGLPYDRLYLNSSEVDYQTSPTNIGMMLIKHLIEINLSLETETEDAIEKLYRLMKTLSEMETCHGHIYNWVDARNGGRIDKWPTSGEPINPKISSVDSAWLAVSLMIISEALSNFEKDNPKVCQIIDICNKILNKMDFAMLFNEEEGVFHSCYTPSITELEAAAAGRDAIFNPHNLSPDLYRGKNSETRLIYWVAVALKQIDWRSYFRMWNTPPPDHPNLNQITQGEWREYSGVPTYGGYVEVDGHNIWKTNDGAAFQWGAVPMFVPEARWFPESWGKLFPAITEISLHTKNRIGGFFGFTTGDTHEKYVEMGLPCLAEWKNNGQLPYDINPSASFFMLAFNPSEALANLARIERVSGMYSPLYGFRDSMKVVTGYEGSDIFIPGNTVLALDSIWSIVAAYNYLMQESGPNFGLPELFEAYLFNNNNEAATIIKAIQEETIGPTTESQADAFTENGEILLAQATLAYA